MFSKGLGSFLLPCKS